MRRATDKRRRIWQAIQRLDSLMEKIVLVNIQKLIDGIDRVCREPELSPFDEEQ